MKIFLDDLREPYDKTWKLVQEAISFKSVVEKHYKETGKAPEAVSFDHDLHPSHYGHFPKDRSEYKAMEKRYKTPTGLDCAEWLCNFCVEKGIELPVCEVHSHNKVGAELIAEKIMNYYLFYYEEDTLIIPKEYRFENLKY